MWWVSGLIVVIGLPVVLLAGAWVASRGGNVRPLLRAPMLLVVALLSAVAVALPVLADALQVVRQKRGVFAPDGRLVSQIPVRTAGWERVGADEIMSAEVIESLGTDNYVSRAYRSLSAGGPPVVVDFHAAYYTNQIDTVPHVPERCFVGGGLQQASQSVLMDVPLDTRNWWPDDSVPESSRGATGVLYTALLSYEHTDGTPGGSVRLPRDLTPASPLPHQGAPRVLRPLQMRVSVFQGQGPARFIAGYFFIANGGWVASANEVRALAFDAGSEYAYYCKVQFTSRSFQTPEEFVAGVAPLLGELLPEIMRCLPPWVEVEMGLYPGRTGAEGDGGSGGDGPSAGGDR